MMIHCAMAASDFAFSLDPLLVLDPLCAAEHPSSALCRKGIMRRVWRSTKRPFTKRMPISSAICNTIGYKHKRETGSATLPDG